MFDHVIAGFDGRDGGRDAIALAAALRPGRLTIVSAFGHDALVSPGVLEDYWRALQADAHRRLEAVRMELDVDATLLTMPDTSPARALHAAAEEYRADLLVLGSAHHGKVARVVLGDVARSSLHGAPCPVAVAPRHFREQRWAPRRVAVAYDGTPESQEALAFAAAMAPEGGLIVATVWEEPPLVIPAITYTPDVEEMAAETQERARRVLEQGVGGAGVPATARLLHGEARHALCSLADEADVIVVGSRGWGSARRVVLGSTSDHLIHHAVCPVVVVPRPDAAEAPAGETAAATEELVS